MTKTLSADAIRQALAMMKPRPHIEMYPGDWLRDPIAACSLSANGLWWRMTMVMHDAKPYGHLVANNGIALPEKQIALRAGAKSVTELRRILREIDALGIPGRTGDADYRKIINHEPIDIGGQKWTLDLSALAVEEAGIIYSRRMLRDRVLSVVRLLVSPKGVSLIAGLSRGLTHGLSSQNDTERAGLSGQNSGFDSPFDPSRAHASAPRAEADTEDEEGVKGSGGKGNPSGLPDFAAAKRVQEKLLEAGVRVLPPEQIVVGWVSEFGERAVLEVVYGMGEKLDGKPWKYLKPAIDDLRRPETERRSPASVQTPAPAPSAGMSDLQRQIVDAAMKGPKR